MRLAKVTTQISDVSTAGAKGRRSQRTAVVSIDMAVAAAEGKSRRLAMACGVLSQYVKAEQQMAAAAAPAPCGPATTLSLMLGAGVGAEQDPAPAAARGEEMVGPTSTAAAPTAVPLTIFYGGRVVVFEDFPGRRPPRSCASQLAALSARRSWPQLRLCATTC
jgi:jasmonate ZIM domain-containing protein